MIRLIGDKALFAVEYEILYFSLHGTPVGNFRLWVNNHYIGNFDDSDFMGPLQFKLKYVLSKHLRLRNDRLNAMSDNDLIDYFMAEKARDPNEELEVDLDLYYFGRIASFDDFCVLCLSGDDYIRFAWRLYDWTNYDYPGYPREALGGVVSMSLFKEVVEEFYVVGNVQ